MADDSLPWRSATDLAQQYASGVVTPEQVHAAVREQIGASVAPVMPDRDAPIVERIRAAGGIIVGSTVMPDWGMLSSGVSSLHGITRSPLNPSWTAGGSSSGAGAAAAGGYGPLHVGTDIGGSIRLPGTWLGLPTLKPTSGLVALDRSCRRADRPYRR